MGEIKVFSRKLSLQTKGNDQVFDITPEVAELVEDSKVQNGSVTVFISGSTGSVTTIEYEPGLIKDIKTAGERLAPSKSDYAHNATWGDGNGYSHIRSSIIGPSLVVPVVGGKMTLGTWQQIVVIDHDTRARGREVIIQALGE